MCGRCQKRTGKHKCGVNCETKKKYGLLHGVALRGFYRPKLADTLSLCFLLPLRYLPFEKPDFQRCSGEELCGTGPSGSRVVSTKTGWVLPVVPSDS